MLLYGLVSLVPKGLMFTSLNRGSAWWLPEYLVRHVHMTADLSIFSVRLIKLPVSIGLDKPLAREAKWLTRAPAHTDGRPLSLFFLSGDMAPFP